MGFLCYYILSVKFCIANFPKVFLVSGLFESTMGKRNVVVIRPAVCYDFFINRVFPDVITRKRGSTNVI